MKPGSSAPPPVAAGPDRPMGEAFQGTVTNAALAQKATALMRDRCFKCHGAGGAAQNGIFVLDRQKLISAGALVPGNAESLLIQVVRSKSMPLLQPGEKALSEAEVSTLREWVLAGAPSTSTASSAPRSFITNSEIARFIVKDLRATDERYQKFQRYYSLAHLYNAGVPKEELELYRGSLAKLLNSLSWSRVIMKPVPIDPARTIFRVDLRLLDWTKNDLDSWRRIVAAYRSSLPCLAGRSCSPGFGVSVTMPYIRGFSDEVNEIRVSVTDSGY
jgi:mono/diheme cytochrome c family protein